MIFDPVAAPSLVRYPEIDDRTFLNIYVIGGRTRSDSATVDGASPVSLTIAGGGQ